MSDLTHVEQRDFTLRIELRCAFPADYDGDADGYAWWSEVEPATAEIVRAAVAILARQPGCRVRPANRGRPSDEEVTLVVERQIQE
jgi:hypothetical protein